MKAPRLTAVFIGALLLLHGGTFVYSEESRPQRVISLGPGITEGLYILGVDQKLVGCTVYCQSPAPAKKKEKVGTAVEINLEKVVSLKPDLVLSTSLVKPEAKEKLKALGIRVVDFPSAKNFDEICEQFLMLGALVGRQEKAEEIVSASRTKVDSVKKKVAGLHKPRVFFQIGAKPLVTVTQDSFINDFIEFAGGTNIARGIKYARYSREKVLEDNPDVIIIATMGVCGEKEREIWQRYKTLYAVRDNRIYIVDSDIFCHSTPPSFAQTTKEMAEILHPLREKNE